MNSDYRITTDALDHPKLIKLKRIHGPEGILCLFRLWGFTARYHCKGTLEGCTGSEIEIACQWNGPEGALIQALLDSRLLDFDSGTYSVHNWEERNGYCFHAPERSAQAKHAVQVREDKRSSARSSQRSSPSPSPSPVPPPDPVPKPKDSLPEPTAQPSVKSSGNGKVKRKGNTIPIEDRNMKTPGGRLVQQWYRQYKAFEGVRYSGDPARMGGNAKTLLKTYTYPELICYMNFLFQHEPHSQYRQHTWEYYVRKISTLAVESKQNHYFPDKKLEASKQ